MFRSSSADRMANIWPSSAMQCVSLVDANSPTYLARGYVTHSFCRHASGALGRPFAAWPGAGGMAPERIVPDPIAAMIGVEELPHTSAHCWDPFRFHVGPPFKANQDPTLVGKAPVIIPQSGFLILGQHYPFWLKQEMLSKHHLTRRLTCASINSVPVVEHVCPNTNQTTS